MGTRLGLGAGTARGVDGKRELHERVAAVAEGVVLARLDPRQLKRSHTRRSAHPVGAAGGPGRAAAARLEVLWK